LLPLLRGLQRIKMREHLGIRTCRVLSAERDDEERERDIIFFLVDAESRKDWKEVTSKD
jgi:hypothetical protein